MRTLLSVMLYTGAFFTSVQLAAPWLHESGILPKEEQPFLCLPAGDLFRYLPCDAWPVLDLIPQGAVQRNFVPEPHQFVNHGVCHRVAFVGTNGNLHGRAIVSGRSRYLHQNREVV